MRKREAEPAGEIEPATKTPKTAAPSGDVVGDGHQPSVGEGQQPGDVAGTAPPPPKTWFGGLTQRQVWYWTYLNMLCLQGCVQLSGLMVTWFTGIFFRLDIPAV